MFGFLFTVVKEWVRLHRVETLLVPIMTVMILGVIFISQLPRIGYSFPSFIKTYSVGTETRKVEYSFPTQEINNFFKVKPAFSIQTVNKLLGKKVTVSDLQDNYDFSFIKNFPDESRIEVYEDGKKSFDLLLSDEKLVGFSYVYFRVEDTKNVPDYYVQEYLRAIKMVEDQGQPATNYVISGLPTIYSKGTDNFYGVSLKTKFDVDLTSNESATTLIRDGKFTEVIVSVFGSLDDFTNFLMAR